MDLEARPVPRSPAGISCENWTGTFPRPLPCAALSDAGITVEGPLGRGADPAADLVLLTVPDGEIAAAAAALTPHRAQFVGHCSGATTLEPLAPHEALSLHPLMTVPEGGAATFAGAGCAVAGATPAALRVAEGLARALGMRAVEV